MYIDQMPLNTPTLQKIYKQILVVNMLCLPMCWEREMKEK